MVLRHLRVLPISVWPYKEGIFRIFIQQWEILPLGAYYLSVCLFAGKAALADLPWDRRMEMQFVCYVIVKIRKLWRDGNGICL